MNYREEILKTIQFQKTEKTPFAVLYGQMWICASHGLTAAQLLDLPDAGAQLLFDEYQKMGTYILTAGCTDAWVMMRVMGGETDLNRLVSEIIRSPLKKIEEIEKFDVQQVIAGIREDHYYQRSLLQMRKLRELAGDQYLITGGFFGPFTLAAQMVGLGKFMLQLRKGAAAEKILQFATELCIANYKDLAENGLDLVMLSEPMASGDMISLAMTEELAVPADKVVRDRMAEVCPNTMVHICGETSDRVAPLAREGFGIFSVDSIDMVQAQKDSDGRMALFGNVSPAKVLGEKSAEEVYDICLELCRQMKPYGGFILAPGCDLAPTIPLENIQAMAKAAQDA
ncbi:MAG: uroporphyrinogen decarboxylase family protein [Lachnospiraceae bacterium]|nr:uroporphyrinogen decarboxylase family protein [Lachnospiraceae bacterium]